MVSLGDVPCTGTHNPSVGPAYLLSAALQVVPRLYNLSKLSLSLIMKSLLDVCRMPCLQRLKLCRQDGKNWSRG